MLRGNRLAQAEAVFQELVSVDRDRRREALDRLCGADDELRGFVEQLLVGDGRTKNDFLESPVISREKAEVAVDESLPQRIGRYEIIRKLGEGGMGIVYEARQDHPNRTVALKVISPGMTSRQLIRRFQHEADVLGQLQHPGIAHIYEAGVAEVTTARGTAYEQPYLAMELIHGPPLHEYARRHELSTHQRLELVARVCDAVHHAHQKGVIHRDLKPANILVAEHEAATATEAASISATKGTARRTQTERSLGQPKVLDFGVARVTESDVQTVTLRTDVGQLIGTVPYMSPEQVNGDPGRLDVRSDVYALGVVLYELLSGRLPIDVRDRSIPEAVRLIQEEEPSRLSSINTVFRGDVETIVARAMEKDRERRYPSAADLGADIRRYLHDEPIVARPASAMYQLRKFAKRNTALVGGAAAVFGTLLFGVIGMAWFAVQESQQRQLAEQSLDEAQSARVAEHKQRELAERRFDEVRQLARIFIYDIYDEIESLAGATQAREQIIRTAVSYLDRLATEASDDTELLNELVEGYTRLGNLLGKTSRANLGDTGTSLEVYQKALALAQRMAELQPDAGQTRALLARTMEHVGSALRTLGRTDEAIAYLRKHLEIMEALEAEYPDHPSYPREVAFGHANIGRMELAVGKFAEALRGFGRYEAFLVAAMEKAPDDRFLLNNYGIILNRIADIHSQMGDHDKARELNERSLRVSERLVAEEPQNAAYLAGLASTRSNLGRNLMRLGQKEEGLRQILASRELRKSMVAADPSDARARRNLAVSEFTVADAYEKLGRDEAALPHFENYRDQLVELVATDPNYIVLQRDLALGYQRIGILLNRLKRPQEALVSSREALTMFQRLAATDRADALAAQDEALAYGELGTIQLALAIADELSRSERLEKLAEARSNLVRMQEMVASLQSSGRMSKDRLDEYETMMNLLADCESRIRSLDGEAVADVE